MFSEHSPYKRERDSSPEDLERRKVKWERLRNFALAASLLVNGGIALDRVQNDYNLSGMQNAIEHDGYSFTVERGKGNPDYKGDFTLYAENGIKYLVGKGTNGTKSWESKFILPRGLDIPATIERMKGKDDDNLPIVALDEVIEVATYGELTNFDENHKPTYRMAFGSVNPEETMKVKEFGFDKDGRSYGYLETRGELENDSALLFH